MNPNPDLMNKLHEMGVIDKRLIFWWQLGFEDRRVWSINEFDQTLVNNEINVYKTKDDDYSGVETKEFSFWPRDDVPILLKSIKFENLDVPVFISVKPLSHEVCGLDWLIRRTKDEEPTISPGAYLSPHIRGVVVGLTNDFLFWSPFMFGAQRNTYGSYIFKLKNESLPIILCPVTPGRFYKNLIVQNWSGGKRCQKKAESRELQEHGIKMVPYYEFEPGKDNASIYPAKVFPKRMDLPTILIGGKTRRIPEILGTGWFGYSHDKITDLMGGRDIANYWQFSEWQLKNAKSSLIERLGRI